MMSVSIQESGFNVQAIAIHHSSLGHTTVKEVF